MKYGEETHLSLHSFSQNQNHHHHPTQTRFSETAKTGSESGFGASAEPKSLFAESYRPVY